MIEHENKLLKRLTELDFATTDLSLYLDTHPHDQNALAAFDTIVAEADNARCDYEKHCGPLTSSRNKSGDCWSWINNPWPWQKQFNFKESPEIREGHYVDL